MSLSWPNHTFISLVIDKFTLQQRIFLGYILTIIILIFFVIVTFFNNAKVLETFHQFSKYNEYALDASRFEKKIITLELATVNYMQNNVESELKKINTLYISLKNSLAKYSSIEKNEESEKKLQKIKSSLDTYMNAFNQVVIEKSLYQTLVFKTLPKLRAKIEKNVSFLEDKPEIQVTLNNKLFHIEKNIFQYVNTLNMDYINNAMLDIKKMKSTILQYMREDAYKSIEMYEKKILEASQRVKGYLYLTHVVMAAEEYEILYQAKKISQTLEKDLEQTKHTIVQDMENYNTTILIILLLFALLMIVMAYIMGLSVTQPLKHLETSFKKMMEGSNEKIEISYTQKDELSALINAAHSFREKNIALQALLEKHQQLSETLELQVEERTKELEEKNEILSHLSITDSLTTLNNRFKINEVIESEIVRADRYKHNFALIMIDIDYFKRINDNFGHQRGDEVLIEISTLLKESIRSTDVVGRWGGEEFMIVCPETSNNEALNLAKNIQKSIQAFSFMEVGKVTVSMGLMSYVPYSGTKETLLSQVDTLLYEAKAAGRNTIKAF